MAGATNSGISKGLNNLDAGNSATKDIGWDIGIGAVTGGVVGAASKEIRTVASSPEIKNVTFNFLPRLPDYTKGTKQLAAMVFLGNTAKETASGIATGVPDASTWAKSLFQGN